MTVSVFVCEMNLTVQIDFYRSKNKNLQYNCYFPPLSSPPFQEIISDLWQDRLKNNWQRCKKYQVRKELEKSLACLKFIFIWTTQYKARLVGE